MNPVERLCAEMMEKQSRRNVLHLNFGSAMQPKPIPPRKDRAGQ